MLGDSRVIDRVYCLTKVSIQKVNYQRKDKFLPHFIVLAEIIAET